MVLHEIFGVWSLNLKETLLHTLKVVLLLYIGALILSWFIQWKLPTEDKPNRYQKSLLVTVDNRTIKTDYLEFPSESSSTVIIIPDIYGGADFLIPLALELSDSMNVIIPMYPEESVSGPDPGYSAEERADVLRELLNSLNLDQQHIAGQGYGGLVAMKIATESTPGRFESLILLSSYGPQELQFLGNYYINRTLYSLLYPVVGIFKYAVPHMGWYHEQQLNFSLVNALMSLDQRSVRDWVEELHLPVMINQPLEDKYVAPAIGKEMHRIIPQSIFSALPADHLSYREDPDQWADEITRFITSAENDEVPTRAEADRKRVSESQKPMDDDQFSTASGWSLMILLLLLILISLISEDLSAIGGGLLVAGGILDFHYAILGCVLGAIIGDVSLYFLGSWIGNPVLRYAPFRWIIKQEDLVRAERMFRMRGVGLIFAARFLPGTRFPIYFSSGLLKTKFTFFIGYFMLSLGIWAPLMVGLAAIVGQPMLSYLNLYKEQAVWIFPLLLLILYGIIRLVILLSTVTGRRMVIVRYERFKRRFF